MIYTRPRWRVYSSPNEAGGFGDPALGLNVMLCGNEGRDTFMVEPMVLKIVDEGSYFDKPTITRDRGGREFLQAVLEHAWEIGMRPAGFNDVKLETGAIKYHLEDMRSLVFHTCPAPPKGSA